MICTRINDSELVRFNYTFTNEGKTVRVWNNDSDISIAYEYWLNNYYIVDKWRNI